MRSINRIYGASISQVINLDCIVPSSRHNHVRVYFVKLSTENSIGVTNLFISFFHFECELFSGLVVDMNVFITACNCKHSTVCIEVHCVNVIFRIGLYLMKQLAWRYMPMSKSTISSRSDKYIRCFHAWRIRAPLQRGDRHSASHIHIS